MHINLTFGWSGALHGQFQKMRSLLNGHSRLADLHHPIVTKWSPYDVLRAPIAQGGNVSGIDATVIAIAMNANGVLSLGSNVALNLPTAAGKLRVDDGRQTSLDGTKHE
eukprot:CAMPEP_0178377920 /NCGR_PEP_ID=MMETSP0689_2-20121128/4163_1 /TAXON_ID=160604 /ORGANISM="Amphidinium massartii, Strain CS-259" /LENGTH=108 /DNA_ID=CAMNT_0019997981 /DNA_START=272 /DNA_END=598 /DNA_ORIENTATION=+